MVLLKGQYRRFVRMSTKSMSKQEKKVFFFLCFFLFFSLFSESVTVRESPALARS